MRKSSLMLAAMLAWTIAGCGGGEEEAGTPAETAQAPQTETVAAPPAEAEELQQAAPQQPAPAPVQRVAAYDEPWTPTHTGTVNPGMSYEDVVGVWGEPVTERTADGRRYLYFRNGCEASCGTFDVVFLENGQVVDAIVRGQGHDYAGSSSSPAGREAVANVPPQAGG